MINLAPLPQKALAHKAFRTRVTVVGLALFLIVILLSVAFLFAPYFLASTKARLAEQELVSRGKGGDMTKGETYADVVKATNTSIGFFLDENDRTPMATDLFARVTSVLPPHISISDLSLEESADEQAAALALVIGGVAADRAALLSFVEALGHIEGVSEVTLPLSNYTKNADIDFTIHLLAS